MTDPKHSIVMTAPTSAPLAPASRMHPMVSAAMAGGALSDPATLRELMALQREWQADEARKSYTRALADLKRDLPTVIARDKAVAFGDTRYTHTSLAAVMTAITEPLTSHGFSLAWEPSTGERAVKVTCRLTHSEGHSESCTLDAPADTGGRKSPAQAIASTITLLERYTALALLGIATADMPEDTGQREAAPTDVDPAKNLRAAKWLADRGITQEAASARVGRAVSAWTASDLAELRAWGTERAKATHDPSSGEVRPEDEPA